MTCFLIIRSITCALSMLILYWLFKNLQFGMLFTFRNALKYEGPSKHNIFLNTSRRIPYAQEFCELQGCCLNITREKRS